MIALNLSVESAGISSVLEKKRKKKKQEKKHNTNVNIDEYAV